MSPTSAVTFILSVLGVVSLWCPSSLSAQTADTLEQRIKKIMDRPEFAHSRFGVKFIATPLMQ